MINRIIQLAFVLILGIGFCSTTHAIQQADGQPSPNSQSGTNGNLPTWQTPSNAEDDPGIGGNSGVTCLDEKAKEDEFPSIKVSGFFQLDAGYFSQDAANKETLGDIDDGLGFRRARLAAKGNVAEDTSYIIEFDIAQSQARFVDVWMQQNDTRIGNVRIGRFRQPFGMSELTSVRELPFLERPLSFTQSPFRQT